VDGQGNVDQLLRRSAPNQRLNRCSSGAMVGRSDGSSAAM
jgi:hypothetical protein